MQQAFRHTDFKFEVYLPRRTGLPAGKFVSCDLSLVLCTRMRSGPPASGADRISGFLKFMVFSLLLCSSDLELMASDLIFICFL
jgi:hypothetical protein